VDDVLTEEQRMLVDASSRLISDVCPLERVRDGAYDDPAFAAGYRHRTAELGWYSLLVPEELGGGSVSGNGVLDAAIVAYHRGRTLQPGPFVGTNVVAPALAIAGDEGQRTQILPTLISGEASAAWAVAAAPGAPVIRAVVTATTRGGGYRLSGQATFVENPGPTGRFLVAAATEEGPAHFLLHSEALGPRVVPLDSLDITRRFVQLNLDDVDVTPDALVGVAGSGGELSARLLALSCVLTVAESVGAMDYDLGMAVQYAKDRIAFGRPIGSFQAIKHLLADTSLLLEMSKAMALAAAERLGEEIAVKGTLEADADGADAYATYGLEAASMAKAFVGDCGIDLGQACFQVFGGIGFTWEHDQHLYLRRLTTDAAFFGDPVWHRERLCELSGI
jgi:alkylation response protein AidB-like acyl-CoA dehydrogenase